jgi:hypothetical protein
VCFKPSASQTASSTDISQPADHASRPEAPLNRSRAGSSFFSNLDCSAGMSGAPMRWRKAAAAPVSDGYSDLGGSLERMP